MSLSTPTAARGAPRRSHSALRPPRPKCSTSKPGLLARGFPFLSPPPPVHPRRLGAAPLAAAGSAFNELARLSFAVRAGDTLHVAMRVLAGEEGSIIILAPGRLAAFRIDESKRVMVACTFAGNASVAWQVRTRRRAAGAAPSSAKHDDVVVRTTTAFIVHENSVSSSFSFRVEKHAHTPPRSTSKLK